MANAAGKAEDGARKTMDEFETQLKTLREDISRLTEHLTGAGQSTYRTARRAASDTAEQLRSQGMDALDGLRANARDLEDQVIETVREKPITALAVAAGVGFLFALLARR